MDKEAWQAQREGAIEAEVGERAARYESWSPTRRLVVCTGYALLCSSCAAAFIALLWTRDPLGAIVMAAGLGVLVVGLVTWFTVAPGHLLRVFARAQTSSTDPAEARNWTIPG